MQPQRWPGEKPFYNTALGTFHLENWMARKRKEFLEHGPQPLLRAFLNCTPGKEPTAL